MKRLLTLLLIILLVRSAFPCSAFLYKAGSRTFVGKNYDWTVENGRVLENKRGVTKKAFGAANPAEWIAKYGSVTFNQYGQEFPCGGMNEKKLVIEALWLEETRYPPPEGNPEIDNMQWIQFQLDNASTIDEIAENDRRLDIRPASPTAVHYFVADGNGNCMIVEFVKGARRHYRPDGANPPVITNDPYDASLRLLQKCKLFGGNLALPSGQGSITRFIKISAFLKKRGSEAAPNPVETAFNVLRSAGISALTKWSIVYDIANLTVYFKSASRGSVKSVCIKQLDFDCAQPVRSIDIMTGLKDDVTPAMTPFSGAENMKLVTASIGKTEFLRYMPKEFTGNVARYPETLRCGE